MSHGCPKPSHHSLTGAPQRRCGVRWHSCSGSDVDRLFGKRGPPRCVSHGLSGCESLARRRCVRSRAPGARRLRDHGRSLAPASSRSSECPESSSTIVSLAPYYATSQCRVQRRLEHMVGPVATMGHCSMCWRRYATSWSRLIRISRSNRACIRGYSEPSFSLRRRTASKVFSL